VACGSGLLILLALMTIEGVTRLAFERVYGDVRPVTVGWSVLVGLAVLAGVVPFVLVARGRPGLAVPFVVVAGAVSVAGYPMLHRAGWPNRLPLSEAEAGILPIYLHPGPAAVALLAAVVSARSRPPAVGPVAVLGALLLPVLIYLPAWLAEFGAAGQGPRPRLGAAGPGRESLPSLYPRLPFGLFPRDPSLRYWCMCMHALVHRSIQGRKSCADKSYANGVWLEPLSRPWS
jgi:hypothetical protein